MKKRVSIILIVLMICSMMVGCASDNKGGQTVPPTQDNGQTQVPQTGKTEIVFAQSADIISLDPHMSNDANSSNVSRQIFSSLLRTDLQMNIEGDLAESWENISPTEWEFKLKKGIKWHDGTDFTAEDVKFSIERQQTMPQVKHLVEAISEVNIIDEYTVMIITAEPCGPLLANLGHSGTRIIPKKAFTEMGEDGFGKNPIGTGPMKFVERVSGDKVVMERFEDYYEGLPKTTKLTMRVIPEGTSRTIALETGEIDLIIRAEPADKKRIEENKDLTLYEELSNQVEWIAMNNKKALFDNVNVRKAIQYAIDKESIIEVSEDGRGEIANTVIGPTVLGYNGDINEYSYDPEKAKELLAEAGYADGLSIVISTSGDKRNRTAQLIQANLADVGITAEIENLEWGAYLDKTAAGEYDIHILGWSNLTADGDGGMYSNFHSSKQGSAGNKCFYGNEEVDKLLEEGRTNTETEKRVESYKKAQEIIMDEAAMVPMYFIYTDIAARKDLKGVELHPGTLHRLHNLYY